MALTLNEALDRAEDLRQSLCKQAGVSVSDKRTCHELASASLRLETKNPHHAALQIAYQVIDDLVLAMSQSGK